MHLKHFATSQIIPLQVTTGVWLIKLQVGMEERAA